MAEISPALVSGISSVFKTRVAARVVDKPARFIQHPAQGVARSDAAVRQLGPLFFLLD